MNEHAKHTVKAVLAADSLALGLHWIYDLDKLKKLCPRVENLMAPAQDSFHPARKRGEFTHYGDQAMVLLASVSASGTFDLDDFFRRWQALFADYDGYVDSATKNTLTQIEKGRGPLDCGSRSNDLAGAVRAGMLVPWFRDDPDALDDAARKQTRMTHQDSETVNAAAFFARVSLACLKGQPPSAAMADIAEAYFPEDAVAMWVTQGLKAVSEESLDAVLRFGQSCHTPEALPGVVQIIARYEKNLAEGIIQAVMAGGDNAARAGMVAQVLAAYNGIDDQTKGWFEELVQARDITEMVATGR